MSWKTQLGKSIKELRFICCQTSPHSHGLRQYIANNYVNIKEQNEDFPFIVRECENAQPMITARYDYGVERKVFVHNLDE